MSRQFEGRSAAEAAIRACEELGVTRAALRYNTLSDTGEGIDRRVVIEVEVDESKSAAMAPAATEPSRDRGDRGERGERRERRGRSDRGGRGERGERGRSRRNGRDDRGRGRRGGRDRSRDREPVARESDDGFEALLRLDEMPATPVEPRPELQGEPSARAAQAKAVLNELFRLMHFDVSTHLVQDDPEEIQLDVSGADAARVAAKKGEPLLSLQFLVNRIVAREQEGEPVVVIDVGGYRERRRRALTDLARRLATRALEEKKVVRLSPMSAHDRRVFHLTLGEMEGVTTRSEGEGLFRRLLIIPSEFSAS